ncbi:MAG: L-lactate permease [Candidatus Aenigmatarchaeota archaeon]
MISEIFLFLPIISLFFLLFLTRDLFRTLFFSYLITLIVSISIGIYFYKILLAHIDSFLTGFKIFLLVFSVLFLFKIIEKENTKFFKSFKEKNFLNFIAIGIFLTILIEGLVGFGTPGIIAVKSLYTLGFNPLLSASISLITDTYSTFGAFSTPIIIGAKDANSLEFVKIVGIIFSIFIFFIFLVALTFYLKFEKEMHSFLTFKKETIASIIVFFIISIIVAHTQFFTLTIILASIGALFFIFFKNISRFRFFLKIFSPFFIAIIIFVILRSSNIPIIIEILNFFNISIIILSIALFLALNNRKRIKIYSLEILKKSIRLFFIIFFLSFVSSYLTLSSENSIGVKGVMDNLKNYFIGFDKYFLIISPIIGVFGAFIFGSATLSNLTFIKFQQEIATALNLNVDKVLALQSIGAGIGNMISLYNISAIIAVIDELKGKEIEILKINSIIAIILSFLACFLVLIL